MKIRAIPQVPNQLDPQLRAVLLAVKENLERLSGQRGGNPVEELLGYQPAKEEIRPWPAFAVASDSYSVETALTTSRLIVCTSPNNTIFTNSGGHFSTSDGKFTAPVAGIYAFSAQYIRSLGNAKLEYLKNGGYLIPRSGSLSYGPDWQTASLAITLELQAGEAIQAIYSAVNGTTVSSWGALFSGHLVAAK